MNMKINRDARCDNCVYWVMYDAHEGFCHRHPPTPKNKPTHDDADDFITTVTFDDYWCGEHPNALIPDEQGE